MISKSLIFKHIFVLFIFTIFFAVRVEAKTIAVLPFEVLSENKEYKQFGIGTMDTISVALTGIPEFTMIGRGQLTNILKEQSFQNSGFSDINESVKTGKLLGAQILVTGSIQTFDNQFRVTANFIDVETGKIIKATKVTGNNIFDLQDKVAEQLIQIENVKLTSEQRNEVSKITKATDNTIAYDNYNIAKNYYYQIPEIVLANKNNLSDTQQLEIMNNTIVYLDKALEADPKYFLAIALKSRVQAFLYAFYVSSKEYKNVEKGMEYIKQAETNAYKAFNLSQNSASVYGSLALVNHVKGDDSKKTILYSLKALEYNPNDQEIYVWLSVSYYSDGYHFYKNNKFPQAIEALINSVKYLPHFSRAYFYLAKSYEKTNEIDKAISAYREALSDIPEGNKMKEEFIQALNDTYQIKANDYYKKSDFNNLEKTYIAMLVNDPKNSDLYNNLAIAYAMQKKYLQAEEMYKKAIEISPNNGRFYDNLGLLYQAKGNKELAESIFKKACELGNKPSCK